MIVCKLIGKKNMPDNCLVIGGHGCVGDHCEVGIIGIGYMLSSGVRTTVSAGRGESSWRVKDACVARSPAGNQSKEWLARFDVC